MPVPMNSCFSADLVLFHFLLLNDLANSSSRDYAAIVFFANNRFETGKKKLQYLTFQDFAFCAGQLINNWTLGAVGKTSYTALTQPTATLEIGQSWHSVFKYYCIMAAKCADCILSLT